MLTPVAPARSAMFAATTSGPSARKSDTNAATVLRTPSSSALRGKVADHEGQPRRGGDAPVRDPRDHERRVGTAWRTAPRGRSTGLPHAGAGGRGGRGGGAGRAHRIHPDGGDPRAAHRTGRED